MADRSAVLAAIRSFRAEVLSELDRFEDAVMSMIDDRIPEPASGAEAVNDEWMTVKEVCEALKISDATFYARVKDGTFPPGFAFSAKSKRWKLSEIIAWQDKSQSHDTEEQPKTITRRRGRVSRVRRIEDFCRV